jgi:hypothetical protein
MKRTLPAEHDKESMTLRRVINYLSDAWKDKTYNI